MSYTHDAVGRGSGTVTRLGLAAVEVFIGVGAVYGGITLIADGWALPLSYLEPLPLSSWTWPGIALLAVVAVPMLGAAYLTIRRHPLGGEASVAAGLLLIGWIIVQVAVMGLAMAWQPVMAVLGAVVAPLGWRLTRTDGRR
jgi:hypothetical protein